MTSQTATGGWAGVQYVLLLAVPPPLLCIDVSQTAYVFPGHLKKKSVWPHSAAAVVSHIICSNYSIKNLKKD